jgi:hypothetical protein
MTMRRDESVSWAATGRATLWSDGDRGQGIMTMVAKARRVAQKRAVCQGRVNTILSS